MSLAMQVQIHAEVEGGCTHGHSRAVGHAISAIPPVWRRGHPSALLLHPGLLVDVLNPLGAFDLPSRLPVLLFPQVDDILYRRQHNC